LDQLPSAWEQRQKQHERRGRGVSTARTGKRRTQGSIDMSGVLIMQQLPRHLSK
jgi:hypothetical protein